MRFGVSVVDVGTDHGYLCALLAHTHPENPILGCDIAPKPLENAKKNIEHFGLLERVQLRLSDGLDSVLPSEAQDIVILGMGGTLIVRLLDRHAWLKDHDRQLILQPMTRAYELRRWLCDNGFSIHEEIVAREGRRLYVLMRCSFTGRRDFPLGYEYYGELPRLKNADSAILLQRTAGYLEKITTGQNNPRFEELAGIVRGFCEF